MPSPKKLLFAFLARLPVFQNHHSNFVLGKLLNFSHFSRVNLLITLKDNIITLYLNGKIDCHSEIAPINLEEKRTPLLLGQSFNLVYIPFTGLMSQARFCNGKIAMEAIQLHLSNSPHYPQGGSANMVDCVDFFSNIPVSSSPLKSLQELEFWSPGQDPCNVSHTSLRPRSHQAVQKVLHCHDMKGGLP